MKRLILILFALAALAALANLPARKPAWKLRNPCFDDAGRWYTITIDK